VASLTIRNLDDQVKTALRVRAARRGRSMEDEARHILKTALREDDSPRHDNLADGIAAIFDPLGGVELDIAPREPSRDPPDFGGPHYDPGVDDHPRHQRPV
jgi:plasmid stability protein